ncbi:MAG: hypothetical protein Q4F84_01940 [Fibrobacter sp.]|nr:hypothetical protein [Fibrobacter sp.]
MKQLILFLSLVCFFSLSTNCAKTDFTEKKNSSSSTISEPVPDTFLVAFYNVENLFDLHIDGPEYKEYKVGLSNWDSTMQKQKLSNIANVISSINAHIVTLCEVENGNALSDLVSELKERNAIYQYRAIADTPVKTTTCPVVISKFPIKESRTFPVDLPGSAVTRNILEADIQIDSSILKVFVNHWPSKLHPESWRLETAKVLLSRINQLPPQTDYIVIGDLNSDYDEYITFKTNNLDNTNGITGINHIFKTLTPDSNYQSFFTENDFSRFQGNYHYNLWLELPYHERMSHFYKGNRQTPDNILLPRSLYDSTGISYCDNSFEVFTWNGKLLENGKPIRWEFVWKGKEKIHTGKGYSDHLPLLARFTKSKFMATAAKYTNNSSMSISDTVSGLNGFEFTNEGLLAWNNNVSISRDTVNPIGSKYCISITQEPFSSNATIARKVLVKKSVIKNISFDILGSGKISFRTREPEKKWVYYNPPEFTGAKSARYSEINLPKWKRITLDIDPCESKEIEFEIRSGKNFPVNISIDNIKY